MSGFFFLWAIPALFFASFCGISYVVARAVYAGSEAYAGDYGADTARQFEDIFLFVAPERIRRIAWASALAFFTICFLLTAEWGTLMGVFRGGVAGLCGGSVAIFTPKVILAVLRSRRTIRFNEQLVDALLSMSNALKAGFSIAQAFESVVREGQNPIAQEFAVLLHQLRVGVRFEEALVNLEKRVNTEDLTLMVRSIEIARVTGGNLTEVFEKISETIRERIRIQGRIRSLTAQGRLQGIVVGLTPLLLGLAIFLIDPRMMRSFLSSSTGLIILGIVGILELFGALLIRKIIRIDV